MAHQANRVRRPTTRSLTPPTFVEKLRADIVEGLSRHHDRAPVRGVAKLAQGFLRASRNYSYDMNRNGERWLLDTVRPTTVLDVGANVGDYAAAVLGASPNATVHCFELVPTVAETCRQRFAGDDRVHVHDVGLSDRAKDVELRFYADQPRLSSLVAEHDLDFELVKSRVERGDDLVARLSIDDLDLVKIDAEGHDWEILLGFAETLAAGRATLVQFEYGPISAQTGHLLRDYYALLDGLGFDVGKLYPDSVDFSPYDVWRDEDFRGPNYVAVHRESGIRRLLAH